MANQGTDLRVKDRLEGSIRFRAPEVPIDGAGRGAALEGAQRPKAPPPARTVYRD